MKGIINSTIDPGTSIKWLIITTMMMVIIYYNQVRLEIQGCCKLKNHPMIFTIQYVKKKELQHDMITFLFLPIGRAAHSYIWHSRHRNNPDSQLNWVKLPSHQIVLAPNFIALPTNRLTINLTKKLHRRPPSSINLSNNTEGTTSHNQFSRSSDNYFSSKQK